VSKVIFDEVLRSRLNGLDAPVELCDQSGQTVGHVLPHDVYLKLLYDAARAQATEEELDRISHEPGGRPLAEIWKSLGRA
jgi:hypothetical protein